MDRSHAVYCYTPTRRTNVHVISLSHPSFHGKDPKDTDILKHVKELVQSSHLHYISTDQTRLYMGNMV